MSGDEGKYAHYTGHYAHGGQQYYYPIVPHPPYAVPQTSSSSSGPNMHVSVRPSALPSAPTSVPAPPPPPTPSMSLGQIPPPRPPGYVSLPRNYAPPVPAPAPSPPSYRVGWQYHNPIPLLPVPAPPTRVALPPARSRSRSRSRRQEIEHVKTKEKYWHYEYEYPPGPAVSSPPGPDLPLPPHPPSAVLLCHTCSECGRMRSAGYHREYPVVPGQPLIAGVCRRCKKKQKKEDSKEMHCTKKYTHIRSCTADEPCDFPNRGIHIRINNMGCEDAHRGRRRSRSHSDDIRVVRRVRSASRGNSFDRSHSRTRIGLRLLQDSPSPPRVIRKRPIIRYRSPTPSCEAIRSSTTRIIQRSASVSPPPRAYRPRSISPLPYRRRQEQHSSDAEKRVASYPMPYSCQPVLPDHRAFYNEASPSASPSSQSRVSSQNDRRSPSQTRGILKPSGHVRETAHRRRMSLHRSAESTMVEVGGPRVQFAADTRGTKQAAESTDTWKKEARSGRYGGDGQMSNEDYDYNYYQRRDVEGGYQYHRAPSPPAMDIERLSIRTVSPPPRGRTPNRSSTPYPNSYDPAHSPSSSRTHSTYIYLHPPANSDRAPPPAPPTPRLRSRSYEDETESGSESTRESAGQREVVDVRSWRDVDENGERVRFVEERRTVYFPEERRAGGERVREGS
ncbi:hypothetical protein K469DRAFT_749468 [Zopfia rhizophila CBS 207.26]|uniref:Uncharacterized protein n=1 Tax=Zopfia rhizophila CBS 207.26 TaxID=1314779 RepID=A0A6A6E8H3_9PEZI|nr:hypothetical protein K469DRAFT_749468 [Zopfia rhizophila CBS 207.26]